MIQETKVRHSGYNRSLSVFFGEWAWVEMWWQHSVPPMWPNLNSGPNAKFFKSVSGSEIVRSAKLRKHEHVPFSQITCSYFQVPFTNTTPLLSRTLEQAMFSLRYSGLCLHLFKNHSHHMVSPWKSTFCNMFFFSDGRIKLHGWEREEPYYQTGSKRKKDSYFVQEHIILLLVLTHSVIVCFSTGRPHSFYCKANCHTWVAANSIWTTQLSLHKITKRGNFQHADLHTSTN